MRTRVLAVTACLGACAGTEPDPPPPLLDAGRPLDAGVRLDAGLAPDAGASPACRLDDLPAWTDGAALPSGRESHVAIAYDEAVHVLGGWIGATATTATYRAEIRGAGLGPWVATESLPESLQHHGVTVGPEAVCVYGGAGVAEIVARVWCRPRVGGAWTEAAPLPAPRAGHETVRVGDDVYVLGGTAAPRQAPATTVFASRLNAAGRPTAWREATALPQGVQFGAAAADDGHIYVVAGFGRGVRTAVLAAEVGPDGALGAWQAGPPLPEGRYGATAWVEGAHLWVAGGADRSGNGSDRIWAAELRPDGLGAWQDAPPLPGPRFGHAAVRAGARRLILGGWQDTRSPPRADVYARPGCP